MTDKPIYWVGSSKKDISIGQKRYKQMLEYRLEEQKRQANA